MPLILFVLFVVVPILELAVIIKIGGLIGVLPTIALMLGMAALGAIVIRSQGQAAFTKAVEAIQQGRPPVKSMIDGVAICIAGLLMLTPGFLSDILGFLLLIPFVRHWLAGRLFRAATARTRIDYRVFRQGRREQPPADEPQPREGPNPNASKGDTTIIDAEFERIDDEDPPKAKPR